MKDFIISRREDESRIEEWCRSEWGHNPESPYYKDNVWYSEIIPAVGDLLISIVDPVHAMHFYIKWSHEIRER
jgi:hypothetical protein